MSRHQQDTPLPFATAPDSLCILRLSAIGDICHTLPVIRTLQDTWPQTRLSWIIGKTEYALLEGIPDIDFIVFDKSRGLDAYREVRRKLKGHRFDALLHMQMSLRSSLLSLLVESPVKLGFDRARAGDLQWLFTNYKIAPRTRQHVMDSLFGFSESLGIQDKHLRWDIPISAQDRQIAEQLADPKIPYLVISPASSQAYRNWHVQGYAQLADYASRQYGLKVYLTGGTTRLEREMADEITALTGTDQLVDLVGRTSLKQLLVILENSIGMIAPDSGPAHMATTVNTPVIGLYACTNAERARPYLSKEWTINRYPEAVSDKYHKHVDELPWGTRVRDVGTMDLISIDDVKATLDRLMRARSVASGKPENHQAGK